MDNEDRSTQTLTSDEKITRILYVTGLENRFTSGDPVRINRFIGEEINTFFEYVFKNLIELVIAKCTVGASNPEFPRKSHIFYFLSKAINSPFVSESSKQYLSKTVKDLAISDREFFEFLQYCAHERHTSKVKGLSHSVLKTVKRYYNGKSEVELVDSYITAQRYHSWAHKDLFKLSHIKANSPLKQAIIKSIMFNEIVELEDEQEMALLNKISKARILRCSRDENEAVPLIIELKSTIKQVCPSLYRSEQVWIEVLQNMTLQECLAALPRIHKANLLKKNSTLLNMYIHFCNDTRMILSSGIHPMEVFIYWKNFEKGGRPIDPKLIQHLHYKSKTPEEIEKILKQRQVKCPKLFQALENCMNVACTRLPKSNKRFLITLDTSIHTRHHGCITSKTVTPLELAVAYTHIILKVERDVRVATFEKSGQHHMRFLLMDRNASYAEHYNKIAGCRNTYIHYNAPIEFALVHRMPIDNFIMIFDHACLGNFPKKLKKSVRARPERVLVEYREELNLRNARVVYWCPTSVKVNFVHDPEHRGILHAGGLDGPLCKAVDNFCRGMFS